jgi:hypothetical protein
VAGALTSSMWSNLAGLFSILWGAITGVVPFQWRWPGTRSGGARAVYHALTGLPESGRDGIPRALPCAVLFRPVGALYLPRDLPAPRPAGLRQAGQALKGRNKPRPLLRQRRIPDKICRKAPAKLGDDG